MENTIVREAEAKRDAKVESTTSVNRVYSDL